MALGLATTHSPAVPTLDTRHFHIVRTYELNARKPLFTSLSIVIYRDNYPDHRAIEARSFTTIHELPMGLAPVLEGSMRRHTTMAIALGTIQRGRVGNGL